MIRLASPLLQQEEAEAVARVLASGWLVQGQQVAEFERLLAGRTGTPHVVACSSGTSALSLALAALELPAGSTVVVPDFTFPATINSVLLAGLTPVVVDVDPGTWNHVPAEIEALLRSDRPPAAILAVHQFGLPADLEALLPLAAEVGCVLIEDAACALGASLELGGRPVPAGAIGRMGCFSFHPRKVITTGEGGAVSTADPALDARLRRLRNHGMERGPGGLSFVEPGWNLRLSELHGAIGVVQMGRLDAILEDRQRLARGYFGRLADLESRGLGLPEVPAGALPTWQSFVVRIPAGLDVHAVIAHTRDHGVETNVGAQALHLQPAYRDLPGLARAYPGAQEAMARALSLPVAWGLGEAELDRIAAVLADAFAAQGA